MVNRIFSWFETLLDPYQPYDETKPPPSTLLRFYAYFLWPARWMLLISMGLGLIAGVSEAVIISFAGDLVDILSGSSPETFWEENQNTIWFMIAVAVVLRPLAVAADAVMMGQGFYPSTGALIRWRTHRHMLRQSVGFFNDDFAGRIANKQIQLAPALNDSIYQLIDTMWYSLIYLFGVFFILAGMDARILIPLAAWFVLYVATGLWFIPKIMKVGKELAEERSRLAGRIVDSYTNIQTVKLFAHAEREEQYGREAMEDLRWTFARQTRLFSSLGVVMVALSTILLAGVISYVVWLWMQGAVTVGVIATAAALLVRLNSITDWIMWTLSMVFQNIGVVLEGMETVSKPRALQDDPQAKPIAQVKGEIEFKDVAHQYGRTYEEGAPAGGVKGLSFRIAPGERVGIVGRSGAGKSTMVNLMLRFFDPESGRVLIDGQDVSKVTQESLRSQIGMVTQDTSLLHRSVLENILYGAPDAGREAAVEAAKQVLAHEFILDLEDRDGRKGYDAHVGERGVKLSGGQRQRIALARVVLKDAPILVLDEATSALDSEVEAAILDAMNHLMEGKTVIAIAHRLSTIAQMDRIIVLDGGRVIEEGAHAELLASGGLYAQLWARQSGGFLGFAEQKAV